MMKRKPGRPRRQSKEYQFDICLYIAMGKSTRSIVDMLQDKYKIRSSFANIDANYRMNARWKKVVSYLRERYLKNMSRIPIYQKTHRLRLLDQAATEALTWRKKSKNEHGVVYEMKIGALPSILEQARKEIEGEKPLVDASKHYHFTSISQKDVEGKDDHELIDIVLGRRNASVGTAADR